MCLVFVIRVHQYVGVLVIVWCVWVVLLSGCRLLSRLPRPKVLLSASTINSQKSMGRLVYKSEAS